MMSVQQKNVYFDMFKVHLFQGQGAKNPFKSLHHDNERYLRSLKENSIAERIDLINNSFYATFATEEISLVNLEEHFVTIKAHLTLGSCRLNLLNELFIKFLRVRCPELTPFLRRVTSFIVVSVLALVGDKDGEFKPEILWELLSTEGLFRYAGTYVIAAYEYAAGDNHEEMNNLKYVDVSLFGEFLYCCVTTKSGYESPMTSARESATDAEKMLISEISNEITSELGLLSFIVYRKWACTIDYLRFSFKEHNTLCKGKLAKMHLLTRDAYCGALENVHRIPLLNEYLTLFLRYLFTQIFNSHYPFGSSAISLDYFNIRLQDYNCTLCHHEFRLLSIVNNILDLLLFLHNKDPNFNTGDFKDIPEFVKTNIIPSHSCIRTSEGFQSTVAMLLATSHFLDFLFLKKWKDRSLDADEFKEIWDRINSDINTRCDSIKEFVATFRLFPFFDRSRDTRID